MKKYSVLTLNSPHLSSGGFITLRLQSNEVVRYFTTDIANNSANIYTDFNPDGPFEVSETRRFQVIQETGTPSGDAEYIGSAESVHISIVKDSNGEQDLKILTHHWHMYECFGIGAGGRDRPVKPGRALSEWSEPEVLAELALVVKGMQQVHGSTPAEIARLERIMAAIGIEE